MSVAKSRSSTTKKISEDIEYTHKWSIENFDDAMEPGRGLEDSFQIPGVLGEFKLKISPSWKTVKLKEFEAKHLFLVNLTFTSVDKDLKAAGMLELVKEGEESQWGKFGDPDKPTFVPVDTSTVGGYRFESNTGLHCTLNIPSYRPESTFDPGAFFTTGSTGRLDLVATITIAGKLVTLGGGAEVGVKEMELFDFKPLLKDPKHSDVILKCGDTRFLCHKVILAARSPVFDIMFDQQMIEDETAEVNILDVDSDTFKNLLEFIYTGKVAEERYTAELLYAADKYDLDELVKLCAHQLCTEVSPETAGEILLLAERHSLSELKQEVMMKIVAEKARYLASQEFKTQMQKNPTLLIELLELV